MVAKTKFDNQNQSSQLKFIPLSKSKIEQTEALLDKGMQLHRAKQFKQAEKIYRQILSMIPNHADASHLLALIIAKREPFKALKLINIALDCHPMFALYYLNRGIIYKRLNQLNRARKDFQRALLLDADTTKAYYELGHTLIKLEQFDKAIATYQKLLKRNPKDSTIYGALGNAYLANRDFQQAIDCYNNILQTDSKNSKVYANLSTAFNGTNQLITAEEYIKKALELEPDNSNLYSQLGKNYKDQGKMEEASFYLEKALSLKPNSAVLQFNHAFWLLEQGKYLEGWQKYEFRFQIQKKEKTYRRFSKPAWLGEDFSNRTLFVYAEQGLGDTLQFVRYLPLIKKYGGTIIFECQTALIPIFEPLKEQLKFDQIISPKETKPEFDYQVALLSLPHIFKTTLETIPSPNGYLTSSIKENLRSIIPANTLHLKVGIVWAGNKKYKLDHKRSIPFKYIKRLLEQQTHIHFYSLQHGERSQDITQYECNKLITDLSEHIQDFTDTTSLIQQMDLIITSDTSMAHLSGALGKNTWVLLAFSPDFRWLLNREDSPWYHSMRLFRQTNPGDWLSVIEQVNQTFDEFQIH